MFNINFDFRQKSLECAPVARWHKVPCPDPKNGHHHLCYQIISYTVNDFGKRKECYFATNHHELVSWKALDHLALFDHLFRNIYTHIFDRECDALQVSGDRYSKGANIGEDGNIGDHARYSKGANIGEDANIGDQARYSKGANIGGHANVGEYATIGAHSTIKSHV